MGLMRSMYDIFKGNEHLMDLSPVEELIEYTQELEGQVLERKIEDTYDKEEIYLQILKDIYESCNQTLEDQKTIDRFKEIPPVDLNLVIINLKKYLESVQKLYGFTL